MWGRIWTRDLPETSLLPSPAWSQPAGSILCNEWCSLVLLLFFSYQSKISQSGRCYITNSELIWKKKVGKHFPTETYLRTVGSGRSFHMVSLFLWHLLHSLAVMVQNNILWLDGRKETKCRTCFKFPCEESNLTAVLSDLHFLICIKRTVFKNRCWIPFWKFISVTFDWINSSNEWHFWLLREPMTTLDLFSQQFGFSASADEMML